MEQIKASQDQAYAISGQLPAQGTREGAPLGGIASQAASQAAAKAPVQAAGDSQSIAFNPAQINPTDLESAHKALDPDRVARLLGLLD